MGEWGSCVGRGGGKAPQVRRGLGGAVLGVEGVFVGEGVRQGRNGNGMLEFG